MGFKKIKTEYLLVGLIAILALALRLWRIGEYQTFLGDEGRDVRIVRDLLDGNLVFIGPQTSIGNMYLGPMYYYMMAPALWLSNLNPVGPAIMIAILSTVTIIFTWWVGRTWFSPLAGLLAALLFSLLPVSIIYSHSSWNPNPMPFFALLLIWSLWQVWQKQKHLFLLIAGFAFAGALQMHYLGLLLSPVVIIFWLKSKKDKSFYLHTLAGIALFLILMSPLVLFDLKHQGMNFNAFKTFFTDRQTTVNINPANSNRFLPVLEKLTDDLVLGSSHLYAALTGVILTIWSIFVLFHKKSQRAQYLLLLAWLGFGYLGLSVYKQHVYAHYFGFLFPAFALLLGFLLARLWFTRRIGGQVLAIIILVYLITLSVLNSPLKYEPNRQLQRTEAVVDLIIQESNGQPFNFGLIAKQNYDESYRYFLENKKANLVRGEEKVVDQLFVVCEDGDACQPEGNPQWQIAVFGPSHVVQEWNIDYIKVYQLLHTSPE